MSEAAKYANAFAPVFKQAAEAAIEEKDRVVQLIEGLEQERKQIDDKVAEMREQLQNIDNNIVVGLSHAAKDAGLKLELQKRVNDSAHTDSAATAPRSSDSDLTKVLTIVPLGRKSAATFGAISKTVDIADGKVVAKALKHLVTENKVKTMGERRGKRYFRE
jgi:hypothetical protein